MAFMTRLGAARPGLVPLGLAIRRRRLGRCARGLGRLLKPKHKLDQLGLAQTLKIVPDHTILNQRSPRAARGWVITMVQPIVEIEIADIAPRQSLGGNHPTVHLSGTFGRYTISFRSFVPSGGIHQNSAIDGVRFLQLGDFQGNAGPIFASATV